MTIRLTMLLAIALLMTGCAGKSFDDFRVSAGFLSPYDAAVEEYKQGKIMEARIRLNAVAKEHEDYKSAQDFLQKKVEPARLKLLRFYAHKGKKEEKQKHWAQAEEAYKNAAALSIQPKALLEYQNRMAEEKRRLRAEEFYQQRKEVDEVWLSWKSGYNPPSGLLGDDEIFSAERSNVDDAYEVWAQKTWLMAEKYKLLDMPEMAWIYADAYLRLKPDSTEAQNLKNAMATAIPKNLNFSEAGRVVRQDKKEKAAAPETVMVSKEHISELIRQQKWAEAKREARLLRIQGDPAADKFLEDIQKNIVAIAEKAYSDGNLAFRLEQIDKAVEFWGQAAYWMPKEQKYVDSLRRGKQIQERLGALKSEEDPAEKDDKIEE